MKDGTRPSPFWRVTEAIAAERDRQDAKWGEQNHPDHDPAENRSAEGVEYSFRARRWQEINAERASTGHTAWDGILLEELYEALAAEDPTQRRAELVQVAAVAVAWIEALDRRAADRQRVGDEGTAP